MVLVTMSLSPAVASTVSMAGTVSIPWCSRVTMGDIVSVNLARTWQYSGDGWNYIANVENVTTGGGEDIIQGNNVANVVDSGAGDDWLYAGGGGRCPDRWRGYRSFVRW